MFSVASMYEHAFSDHYPGDLTKHSAGPNILLLHRLAHDCKSGVLILFK